MYILFPKRGIQRAASETLALPGCHGNKKYAALGGAASSVFSLGIDDVPTAPAASLLPGVGSFILPAVFNKNARSAARILPPILSNKYQVDTLMADASAI